MSGRTIRRAKQERDGPEASERIADPQSRAQDESGPTSAVTALADIAAPTEAAEAERPVTGAAPLEGRVISPTREPAVERDLLCGFLNSAPPTAQAFRKLRKDLEGYCTNPALTTEQRTSVIKLLEKILRKLRGSGGEEDHSALITSSPKLGGDDFDIAMAVFNSLTAHPRLTLRQKNRLQRIFSDWLETLREKEQEQSSRWSLPLPRGQYVFYSSSSESRYGDLIMSNTSRL
ncbi:MAG: hypothetical protein ACRDRJ_00840 [Streptosporangiaceae bacterium]